MRYFVLLVLLLCGLSVLPVHAQVVGSSEAASLPEEEAPLENTRFFQEVQDAGYPGAYHALSRLTYNGNFVLLVETDADHIPISDTLLVWVQHHGPDQPLAKQAKWADLIISCYPELLSDARRTRHVLPLAQGKVWLYFAGDRRLIVSDKRQPALDFALGDL
ncbi:MAG TPA: hypothetical protein VKP65_00365 [Rhodothermales bacterium]|nr:hypothetical protein [Rhodothermales bacterium]